MAGTPQAWRDLINALTMLASRAHPDCISPCHCENDVLTVMADPEEFTPEELIQLSEWGFEAGPDDGTFTSWRYGSV